MNVLSGPVGDGLVIAWRTLKRVPRIPELAIFVILQSIMFVLLFAYVFGGAIPLLGGGSYYEYLMPGIYIQTLGFASITTAIGVADDTTKGIVDRFRSLPMARSGALSGRTLADVVYTMGILIVLDALRARRRLARARERRRLCARDPPDALLHLRDGLGRRAPRHPRAYCRDRTTPRLPRRLPAHLPLERVRADRDAPERARARRRVEPVQRAHAGDARALREPEPFPTRSFPSEHPFLLSLLWTAAILAVFAPIVVSRYRAIDR